MKNVCPCESGKQFSQCCETFLNGLRKAKTPAQLMRSRYTAYALGGYGEYLLSTWAQQTRGGLTAASLSVLETEWLGLDVISKSQIGDIGSVEFKAFYRGEQGETMMHHEKSVFQRVQGEWSYVGLDE